MSYHVCCAFAWCVVGLPDAEAALFRTGTSNQTWNPTEVMRRASKNRFLLSLFLSTCVFSLAVPSVAKEAGNTVSKKRPIPPEDQCERAAKLVREVYREEFDEAKSTVQKSAVAKRMHSDALVTNDDIVSRYVMLRSAREIAVLAGDIDTTIEISDSIEKDFQIEGTSQRLASLIGSLRRSKREPTESATQAVLSFAKHLIDIDDYGAATQLLSTAMEQTRSGISKRRLGSLRDRSKQLAIAFADVRGAALNLKENPDDARDRALVGRFLCFIKGDWSRGIEMLSQCDDDALRKIANEELSDPTSPDEQLRLADQWWDYADTLQGDLKSGAKRHAATFYLAASEKLTGLKKAKANHRCTEAKRFGNVISLPELKGIVINPAPVPKPKQPARKVDENGVELWPNNLMELNLPLPGAFDDVALAGKGQYLLLQISTMKKIVVVDVYARKVVREFPLDQANVRMTANANSMFLATPDDNMIRRYSLRDFKLDRKGKLPFVQPVMLIETGFAAAGGPVFVSTEKGPGVFIGSSTLRPASVQVVDMTYPNRKSGLPGVGANAQVRANANATLFAHRETQYSPNTMRIMALAGRQVRLGTLRESVGYLAPSANGQLLFTSEGVYTQQLKEYGKHEAKFATSFPLPAVSGDLSIRLVRDDNAKRKGKHKARMTVHRGISPEPILTIPEVNFRAGEYSDFHNREMVGIDQRIYFYPKEKLLVTLPPASLSVVIHRLPEVPAH